MAVREFQTYLGFVIAIAAVATGRHALADENAKIEFFEKRIRPVLIQSCYKCHSGQSDEPEGGLRLDSRNALMQGGESGPAIVVGNADESLLISALRYETLEMPPNNRLPDEVIEDFAHWIEMGAPDPRDKPDRLTQQSAWETILESRRDWWSLQPIRNPKIPDTNHDWPFNSIDSFVLAKLQKAGLKPVGDANPRQLVRRLSIVLTGLPPTTETVDRFLRANERNPDSAYRWLIDTLLDSPHFGERWARHWMDVVRFTETHGNEWNYEVHHAWRYRDYLIRAFNSDVPYDQFAREHIAGDLLEKPRWNLQEQFNESLIGTAFYRFGEVNHDDCVTLTSIGYDILDNQIDTLSKAFQATTVACARCHHHKIDAVSMDDYYALLGILKSSRLTAHTIDADSVNVEPMNRLRQIKARIRKELGSHWKKQAAEISRYLLTIGAKQTQSVDAGRLKRFEGSLSVKDPTIEHPLWLWSQIANSDNLAEQWQEQTNLLRRKRDENNKFNSEKFSLFADFRGQEDHDWTLAGQGLRNEKSESGELSIAPEGGAVVHLLLPAGVFTHKLSQKLNGTMRSPALPSEAKFISAEVLGDKTSAFRLISNNCQLNYANYKALTFAKPRWITLQVPDNAIQLNTFAELVTKFDNPKFPDQLGTLGGDRTNDRIPWKEAAADPRSYFGIMRVVLHEENAGPKPDLSAVARLAEPQATVATKSDLAKLYERVIERSVAAWRNEQASDDDVFWLNWCLKNGWLTHAISDSPVLKELVDEYRTIENNEIEQPRISAGVADFGNGMDHPRFERGNYDAPRETVRRRYLDVLSSDPQKVVRSGSGRLLLANAIASPENPLTARVMVNRVWHHLFGTGIVRTVDDFGRVGEMPSHPELLDHLTTEFVTPREAGGMGWSIKTLIRIIANSHTFRLSSSADDIASQRDPKNRLLHHYPARRMEAEAIRDSILMVSGRLQREMYGMSVQPYREKANDLRRLFAGPLDGAGRRSVYIKVNLMEGPKFLSSFNLPSGKIAQGRRDQTNVPAQALALLNDEFVIQQAEVWAQNVIANGSEIVPQRLNAMFQRAIGRPATVVELKRFESLVVTLAEHYGVQSGLENLNAGIWKDIAHILFNTKEFIYIP